MTTETKKFWKKFGLTVAAIVTFPLHVSVMGSLIWASYLKKIIEK